MMPQQRTHFLFSYVICALAFMASFHAHKRQEFFVENSFSLTTRSLPADLLVAPSSDSILPGCPFAGCFFSDDFEAG